VRSSLKQLYRRALAPIYTRLDKIHDEIERNRMLLVQPRIREFAATGPLASLADAEFSVFSQWGEDGILQYLLSQVDVPHRVFIEFGVQDYEESNTRFLLLNNNWRGLVIDAGQQYIDHIRAQDYYWRHDITAVGAYITRENINGLFVGAGFTGDIGILSVDIDGNDYWIWEAIEVVSPRIVVVEYNAVFGSRSAVSVPYSEHFQRTQAHFSNLYFGASLKAFCSLAERKGYVFVGSNGAGNNAFFVRAELAGELRVLTCEEGFVESRLRESRDQQGRLTFVSGAERRELIADQPLVDVEANTHIRVRDLL
jgi:hypothetical protein